MLIPNATVIINPGAGGRSVRREWPQIEKQLQEAGVSFDFEFTRSAGHATEIASQAIGRGCRYLVAVGGDGTVSEVVNGMLRSSSSVGSILGIVPAGTGRAFSHSLGIAEDYLTACSCLAGHRRLLIDVGVVRCWSHGQPVERFFVNEASIGLSAEIVDAWKSLPGGIGRTINLPLRAVAGYKALAMHRNKTVRLRVRDEVESVCICTVVVANGRYCGDRMLIAPNASLNDGVLDAIIVDDVSTSELIGIRPTLYNGSHIRHAKIREKKVTAITIESDEPLLVEADGEVIGETPVSFEVKPSALTVVV
jgi:diacylglycerol kinase (ATP)